MNFQSKAILSMQVTSSACLIGHIVDTNVCAIYDMHVTIMVKDMQSTLVCAVGECVCVCVCECVCVCVCVVCVCACVYVCPTPPPVRPPVRTTARPLDHPLARPSAPRG